MGKRGERVPKRRRVEEAYESESNSVLVESALYSLSSGQFPSQTTNPPTTATISRNPLFATPLQQDGLLNQHAFCHVQSQVKCMQYPIGKPFQQQTFNNHHERDARLCIPSNECIINSFPMSMHDVHPTSRTNYFKIQNFNYHNLNTAKNQVLADHLHYSIHQVLRYRCIPGYDRSVRDLRVGFFTIEAFYLAFWNVLKKKDHYRQVVTKSQQSTLKSSNQQCAIHLYICFDKYLSSTVFSLDAGCTSCGKNKDIMSITGNDKENEPEAISFPYFCVGYSTQTDELWIHFEYDFAHGNTLMREGGFIPGGIP